MDYLFNLKGDWIAFRTGRYVFDRHCDLIGCLPFDAANVFEPGGAYLGEIDEHGRFYLPRKVEHRRAPFPPRPERPAKPPPPERKPPITGPPGAAEIEIELR